MQRGLKDGGGRPLLMKTEGKRKKRFESVSGDGQGGVKKK